MAIDPDIVHRYSEASQRFDGVARTAATSTDPAYLEAQEDLREALSAYILDLEVNGMSVPEDLQAKLDSLSQASEPPPQ
jgi:hypothetical protein